MNGFRLVVLAATVLYWTTGLEAQSLKPDSLQIAGKPYQLLYDASAQKQGVSALLRDATGEQGKAILVFQPSATQGTLYLQNKRYRLSLTATSTNIVEILAPPSNALDHMNPPPELRRPRAALQSIAAPAADGGPWVADVMVLYTPAAKATQGGESGMRATIDLAVAEANQAYIDSGINVRLSLVYAGEVNYPESSSMNTDLQRLAASNDGYLDESGPLQDKYQADMVCLLTEMPGSPYAGLAYVLSGTGTAAYSVVQARYAVGYYVFPHELGHNFGCMHDRANSAYQGSASYAYGSRFWVGNLQYRSIMSYDPGIRVGLFSSPFKTYLGVTVGTATEDNARNINERAAWITSIRSAPTYALHVQQNGSGSLWRDGKPIQTGTITVTRGQVVHLTAQGNFACWSGFVNTNAADIQFTLTQDATLLANFIDGAGTFPPQFTVQPFNQNLTYGDGLELTVEAMGTPEPTFRWYRDVVEVGQGRKLAIPSVFYTDQGTYTCVASNSAGLATSLPAAVTVSKPLQIVQQPVSQIGQLGGSLTFSVMANEPDAAYQWFFNEQALAWATNRTLSLANMTTAQIGNYYVVLSKRTVRLQSDTVQLLLISPPVIVQQPIRTTVVKGENATFDLEAVGLPPLAYQWQFNGNNLPNQTNSNLSLKSIVPGQTGYYRCKVSNPHGYTYSVNAALLVDDPLLILQQPDDLVAVKGTTPIFGVVAQGGAPITYQWYGNGSALSNQVYATCRLKNVQFTNAGVYFVVVKNPHGTLTSREVVLVVQDPPTIASQPQKVVADLGQAAEFAVSATGREPLSYAWTKNGSPILGASGPVFRIAQTRLEDLGTYAVTIANPDGTATSQAAPLTLNLPPSIVVQPTGTTVAKGGTARLSVSATGTGPFTYTWYADGIARGTGDNLALSNIQTNQAGPYWVVVANRLGSVTSQQAIVTVTDPVSLVTPIPSQTVDEGQDLSVLPLIRGKGPYTFAWKKGTQTVSTSPALQIAGASEADAGSYTLSVTGLDGGITSSAFQITVLLAPRIVTQPVAQTSASQGDVTFAVSAQGAGPLTYGWAKDGSPIVGATNNALMLRSVSLGDEGDYDVLIANRLGSLTSQRARLTVTSPPVLTINLPSQESVFLGRNISFHVATRGREPFTYTWYRNGSVIPWGAGSTFSVNEAAAVDAGAYHVVVRNSDGVVTSAKATLLVITPPLFTVQPKGANLTKGQSVTFEAVVSSPATCMYQWLYQGEIIPGATTAQLVINDVQISQAGSYTLRASNGAGDALSQVALLVVKDPPVFTTQPADVAAKVGSSLRLAAAATSSVLPITYQWKKDGNVLSGQIGASLEIPAIKGVEGRYQVIAANADGSLASRLANVQILSDPPTLTNAWPSELTVAPHELLELTLPLGGRTPFAIQWYWKDARLADQIGVTLAIPNFQSTNAGPYWAVISNDDGSLTTPVVNIASAAVPPTISQQPQNQVVGRGRTATFSVACSNPGGLTFQWLKNHQPLAGRTNASLMILAVTESDVATYSAEVSNTYGTVPSQSATLSLLEPPTITVDPAPVAVLQGQNAAFSVQAVGPGTLAYQWSFNGNPIAGATHSSYQAYNVQSSQVGTYSVSVSNEGGTATSRGVTLTLRVPPTLTQQPASLTRKPGDAATFFVQASGVNLAYQWYWKDTLLPGMTASSLTLNAVQAAQAGGYKVKISNPDGSVTSAEATLTILDLPRISLQPSGKAVAFGQAFSLSVTASGGGSLSYQWRLNGSPISGANSSNYSVVQSRTEHAGSYVVTVENAVGQAQSQPAAVQVLTPPIITTQPQNRTVSLGATAQLTVTATGSQPLTYVWTKMGKELRISTEPTLIITNVAASDLAEYRVLVTNSVGSVLSSTVSLSAPLQTYPPGITRQPASVRVLDGSPASFEVAASGTPPLYYQWKFQGTPLVGQTNAGCLIPAAKSNQAGTYTVSVQNAYGLVESAGVTLTLESPVEITGQPSQASATEQQALTLAITATHATGYAWLKNGVLLVQTPVPQLQISSVSGSDAGTYTVKATNTCSAIVSSPIEVTINLKPFLTTQPTGITVNRGGTVRISVQAGGSAPLGYQWFKNGVALPGWTLPLYTLFNAQTSDEGTYSIKVSNPYGQVTSVGVPLAVKDPPVISKQPVGGSVIQGANYTFTMTATGRAPLTYTWFHNGGALPSSNTNVFNVVEAQNGDAGSYYVIVSNSDGSTTSQNVTLTTQLPPKLTSAALNLSPTKGSTTVLAPAITGTEPITWQWRCNGATIIGATGRTLTIGNIQTSQEGTYTVSLSNAAGSAVGTVAFITVSDPPVLTTQPSSSLATPGQNVTFVVSASGRSPMTYQWFKDGTALGNQVLSTLTIVSAMAADAGSYQARVSNADGSVLSQAGVLSLAQAPKITQQPIDAKVAVGKPALMNVQSSGTGPLSFQWLKSGVPIPGATSSSYSIKAVSFQDEGSYQVLAANAVGSVTSTAAQLTISYPPTITQSPASKTVNQGGSVTFEVSADGRQPMTYAWVKQGVALSVTTRTFTINNVQTADAGTYSVTVFNPDGQVSSPSATLQVKPLAVISAQPLTTIVTVSNQLQLTVVAQSPSAMSYQWLKDHEPILRANAPSYAVASVDFEDGGTYSVRITNEAGTIESEPAIVLVLPTQPIKIPRDQIQPQIISVLSLADGKAGLVYYGAIGRTYEIQASSDWIHWETVQVHQAVRNVNEWVDQESNRHPQRFYRVGLQLAR